MRKAVIGLVSVSLAAGLAVGGASLATASPDVGDAPAKAGSEAASIHDLPSPLGDKERALRAEALAGVLNGSKTVQQINGSDVVKMGTKRVRSRIVNQYVELTREETDNVFVILTEFGNERDPRFPDQDTNPATPGPSTFEGPLHNAIPEPDRTTDNSTIWQPDYSADFFRNLYFGTGSGVESLKTFYERQSSGRYSVDGLVTDWVKVRYNEARYGRSTDDPTDANGDDPNVCAEVVCRSTWDLVRDGINQWVLDQEAAGSTTAEIRAQLATYDQKDRYDFDGDGNFGEPDGYLDRFQIVHSGGDEADGDPYQGEDAIWSHRWYAFGTDVGVTGPPTNPLGGTQIGDTGLWVGDYTAQPENGGLSVVAHEYGHDLGLPDHYDTNGGRNGVEYWNLMAQSRLRGKNDVGIGTRAGDLSAWDKLQLGWLDYTVAAAGQTKLLRLGPHEYNSQRPQALAVVLPDKEVVSDLPDPASGASQWWSGSGDGLNTTLTRTVDVPEGSSGLSFAAAYDIETDYDYALVEVNDGSGFASIPTSASGSSVLANGIEGTSDGYQTVTADMSAYAGESVSLRFRYVTDGGVAGNDDDIANNGFFVDDIALIAGGTEVFSDDVESGANGWTAAGFTIVGATVTTLYDNFYLASYRSYLSYDKYLKSGPYNFGFPDQPNKVETFPYAEGLLVSYWDTSFGDNNTSQHPGGGLVLPIDAHPDLLTDPDGGYWRSRIQVYDAPFSTLKPGSFILHSSVTGKGKYIRGAAAQPLFDDRRSYWRAEQPGTGVIVPNAGVTMRVLLQTDTNMIVRLGSTQSSSAAATLKSARAGN